jgi:hypothetical protein
MPRSPRIVEKTRLQFLAGHEEGRSLEICLANPDSSLSTDSPYPLATILETDDYRKWVEIVLPQGIFRLDLCELERAISAAKEGVFSERRWLDELCPKDAE